MLRSRGHSNHQKLDGSSPFRRLAGSTIGTSAEPRETASRIARWFSSFLVGVRPHSSRRAVAPTRNPPNEPFSAPVITVPLSSGKREHKNVPIRFRADQSRRTHADHISERDNRQNRRNPFRCQRMSVSGFTFHRASRQANIWLRVAIIQRVASSALHGHLAGDPARGATKLKIDAQVEAHLALSSGIAGRG